MRSGKLVPEVVRTEKENLETHVEGSMEPVLIDVNSQKTRMTLDEGIKEDGMLHQRETRKQKESKEDVMLHQLEIGRAHV